MRVASAFSVKLSATIVTSRLRQDNDVAESARDYIHLYRGDRDAPTASLDRLRGAAATILQSLPRDRLRAFLIVFRSNVDVLPQPPSFRGAGFLLGITGVPWLRLLR